MKIFSDQNSDTVNIVQSVASASSMISSITGEARQYIVSKFPTNFFKHIYIDTSQTKTQQNYNDNYNINANKLRFPSMTITPEISLDEPIAGTEKSVHLSSPNLYLRRDLNRIYNKILIDVDDDFGIYFSSEYITTNFNFRITTNSFIQNTDTAFFLKSRLQQNFFQYLNGQELQTEIPKSFIKAIADIKGWNLDNPDDMNALRLYLIATSKTKDFIKKKISQTTGKVCFFINQYENLLTLVNNIDAPSSIARNAQAEDTYTISFTLQVSAWVPTAFIFSIKKSTLRKLNINTVRALDNDNDQQESGFYSVIIKTDSKNFGKKETIEFVDGLGAIQIGNLIFDEDFMHELNTPLDTIYLMEKMKKEFKMVYALTQKQKFNIDPSTLINIQIRNNSGLLDPTLYSINYEELSISFADTIDSDINITMYLNRLAYETLKKAIINKDGKVITKFMTNAKANNAGNEVKLIVNYFDKDNYSTSNIDYSLRIQTAYGIGYIVMDKDTEKDSYKICVGYDNNQPIIKKLKIDA